jgi:P4 family phage/plasmid primase-like protien
VRRGRVDAVTTTLEYALLYVSRGWPVLPVFGVHNDGACRCGRADCSSPGKHPLARLVPHGLKDATIDADTIRSWWYQEPEANVAIATGGGLAVIDVDAEDGFEELEARFGDFPPTLESTTGSGGRHLLYATEGKLRSKNGFHRGVDLKADGGYVIVPPSRHASGRCYAWDTPDELPSTELAALPAWVIAYRDRDKRAKPGPQPAVVGGAVTAYGAKALENAVRKVAGAEEGTRNETLNHAAFGLGCLIAGGELPISEVRAALKDAAREAGLSDREATGTISSGLQAGQLNPKTAPGKSTAAGVKPHVFTLGDEQEVAAHVHELIEVDGPVVFAEQRLWQYREQSGIWHDVDADGGRCRVGELWGARVLTGSDPDTGQVETKPLRITKRLRDNAWAILCQERKRSDFFDKASRTLVFLDCTMTLDEDLGLTSGAHSPEHRARYQFPFPYPGPRSARWLGTMREWFAGDADAEDKMSCLQEFVGACLFGVAPQYQTALLFVGPGRNGKTTLQDIIVGLFPPEWVASVGPTELEGQRADFAKAALVGKRLNSVSDLAATEIIKSGTLKALISGDRVSSRAPYGREVITSHATAGHLFSANALPHTRDRTKGFYRRWCIIEFNRIFEDHQVNPHLVKQTLASERANIIAWAVQGAERLWRSGHYTLPASHLRAMNEWQTDCNPVAVWVDERTEPSPSDPTPVAELYADYKDWAETSGYRRVSKSTFGRELKNLGHPQERKANARKYPLRLQQGWGHG